MSDSSTHNNVPEVPGFNIPSFREILRRYFLKYWYLYMIVPLLAVVVAFFMLRYDVPLYRIQSKLLLKSSATSSDINEQALFKGIDIPVVSTNLENEIQILRSTALMERVIDTLNLGHKIYQVGRVQNTEYYKPSPIILDSSQIERNFGKLTLYIKPTSKDVFLFWTDQDNVSEQIFGLPFKTDFGTLSFSFNGNPAHINKEFLVEIMNSQVLARQLASKFLIRASGGSELLTLTITDEIPKRGIDILNTLTTLYEQDAIDFLNKVNRNTIDWVDSRINVVQKELDRIEDAEERYLLKEDLPVSLEVATQKALDLEKQLDGEIRVLQADKDVLDDYRSIMSGLLDHKSFLPSGLLSEWIELESQVSEVNELIKERESKLVSGTELNPVIERLRTEIRLAKRELFDEVGDRSMKLQNRIRNKQDELRNVSSNIYKTPRREREIRSIEREKQTKEVIFDWLLQTREEYELSVAVASSNVRIVEKARSSGVIRSNPLQLYAIALAIGLFLSVFLVALLELLNDKVQSEEEAKNLSGLPVLGIIPNSSGKSSVVFNSNSQSVVSEMFRLLRTNLQYALPGKSDGTLLVTSTTSGEGKTFISINLGLAIAGSSKRVLVIGMDLRQPKLGKYLGEDDFQPGVSTFLVGKASLDEIIKPFRFENDQIDYIPSGPIPPNPAELLLSEKLDELIENLKPRYDYIIIDSPPVGLVADAYLIKKYIDATLIVSRQNHTKKNMLKFIRENKNTDKLENPHLVYNGAKKADQYGYRYGYGYYNKS